MNNNEMELKKLRGVLIFDHESWERHGFPGKEEAFTDEHFKKFLELAKLEKYQQIFADKNIKTNDFLEILGNRTKFDFIVSPKELFKLGAYAFQLRFLLQPVTTLNEMAKGENEKESKKNKRICEIIPASKEKDDNMTKLIEKKKECKSTAETSQIMKKDPGESILFLEQNDNGNNLKALNGVIIGRLKPEEYKYQDFDFFQINTKECSRLHAFIYKNRLGYFLSDHNTPNGTYLKVHREGITFKDTDNLIFEIGTYLYTFQFKMRKGISITKVYAYLYLQGLYEGKTNRKHKCKIEWNSFSSIKCGMNPSPLSSASESCFSFTFKDKKMSNDHFWLKKTKDQNKFMLIPFDSQTEVWVVVKENNKNEMVGIRKGDIIRVANILVKVSKSPPIELPKGNCKCQTNISFDGYVEECGHFYCSKCLDNKKKCYSCNKRTITSYKKIYEYI